MSLISNVLQPHWFNCAVLSVEQMQQSEILACQNGIESFELMRRAGLKVADVIQQRFSPLPTLVVCGPGNNGGDGFVVADALQREGWNVTLATLGVVEDLKGDAARAAKNWPGALQKIDAVDCQAYGLIVDALYGTGLSRPIEGKAKDFINKLYTVRCPLIAIDVPSGVECNTGRILGAVVPATLTITFFRKKYTHLLMPAAKACGKTIVVDIGISGDLLTEIEPQVAENEPELWQEHFPFPDAESHKYNRGHALVLGGAVMTGATRLATRAAQRIGAGLVTLAAPRVALALYSSALESALFAEVDDVASWRELCRDPKKSSVLLGPGLGRGQQQKDFVLAALQTQKSIVLDADALSNFVDEPDQLFKQLHANCVLTPHEGEFARLFSQKIDMNLDKLSRAREAAHLTGCVIVLKGADTIIADMNGLAVINSNAPPWLATAGSGDVLAGIILGLLTQNVVPFLAAQMAVWIHGQVAADFGPGLIAEDITHGIPGILRRLSEMRAKV